jgi:hypothetical protein
MTAKHAVLAAVHAMPEGSSWDDILGRLQVVVALGRDERNTNMEPSASADNAQSQLIARLYPTTDAAERAMNADMDALAADPDIQRELTRIEL